MLLVPHREALRRADRDDDRDARLAARDQGAALLRRDDHGLPGGRRHRRGRGRRGSRGCGCGHGRGRGGEPRVDLRRAERLPLGAAVTAALVALGGTALAFSGRDATPTGTDAVTASATTTTPTTAFPLPSPAATIDRSAAEQAALDHVGGGTLTHHSEIETEHGREFWKVEVADAAVVHTLYVDATTGAVTERDAAARSAVAPRTGSAAPTGSSSARVDDKGGRRGRDDSGRDGGDDRRGRRGGHDDGPNHQ